MRTTTFADIRVLCQGSVPQPKIGRASCSWDATLVCPSCKNEVCVKHWDRVSGICVDCQKVIDELPQ